MIEKQRAVLNNWWFYRACLYGIAYEHPKFPLGTPIRTSRVLYLDEENKIAETLNTIYTLGGKSSLYIKEDEEFCFNEGPIKYKRYTGMFT